MAPYLFSEHIAHRVVTKMKESNLVSEVWATVTKDQGVLCKLVSAPLGTDGLKHLVQACEDNYPELLPMALSLRSDTPMNYAFKLLLEHSMDLKGENDVQHPTH